MRALAAVALVVLAACRGDETVRAYGGGDITWTLQELNGAPFKAKATLSFPKGEGIAGTAPCNQYRASMTAPYPWFEAGPIAATKRACPDLKAETEFLSALARARIVEVAGNTLILSNEDGLSMVFKGSE